MGLWGHGNCNSAARAAQKPSVPTRDGSRWESPRNSGAGDMSPTRTRGRWQAEDASDSSGPRVPGLHRADLSLPSVGALWKQPHSSPGALYSAQKNTNEHTVIQNHGGVDTGQASPAGGQAVVCAVSRRRLPRDGARLSRAPGAASSPPPGAQPLHHQAAMVCCPGARVRGAARRRRRRRETPGSGGGWWATIRPPQPDGYPPARLTSQVTQHGDGLQILVPKVCPGAVCSKTQAMIHLNSRCPSNPLYMHSRRSRSVPAEPRRRGCRSCPPPAMVSPRPVPRRLPEESQGSSWPRTVWLCPQAAPRAPAQPK